MEALSSLPESVSPAIKRSAKIVRALGQELLAEAGLHSTRALNPSDPAEALHKAATDASWKCFTKERILVTLDSLFPSSGGRVHADWYTGQLSLPEGDEIDYQHAGFASTYEADRLIEISSGVVVGERVQTNERRADSGTFEGLDVGGDLPLK
jgi:hypothetical protein